MSMNTVVEADEQKVVKYFEGLALREGLAPEFVEDFSLEHLSALAEYWGVKSGEELSEILRGVDVQFYGGTPADYVEDVWTQMLGDDLQRMSFYVDWERMADDWELGGGGEFLEVAGGVLVINN